MSYYNSAAHRELAALRIAERRRRDTRGGNYALREDGSRWPFLLGALGIVACIAAVLIA